MTQGLKLKKSSLKESKFEKRKIIFLILSVLMQVRKKSLGSKAVIIKILRLMEILNYYDLMSDEKVAGLFNYLKGTVENTYKLCIYYPQEKMIYQINKITPEKILFLREIIKDRSSINPDSYKNNKEIPAFLNIQRKIYS